jgi:hypothetical protein
MMSESFDLRWIVVISCFCITAISPLLTAWGERFYRKQSLFEYPDGYLPPMQQGMRGLLYPLLGTTLFLSLALFLLPSSFEFFGGGLLVSQLVGVCASAGNLFLLRKLASSDSGSGHVVYSASTRYVQLAAHLFSGSLLCATLYSLTGNTMIAGGAFYLFFTSLGYFRRSRQVLAAGR